MRAIYPPRPENAIPGENLNKWAGRMISQPKLDGSYMQLWINEKGFKAWNRHKEPIRSEIPQNFQDLHRGKGTICLLGEWMNKSKKNSNGENFNDNFCVFDIVNYNNEFLTHWTLEDRIKLLDDLYPIKPFDIGLDKIDNQIYRVKTFYNDFDEIWNELIQINMYEGLVLKRFNAKLKPMIKKNNNSDWQLKSRKPTKNYKF